MPDNPWQVKNFQTFLFLNCPECEFKTKQRNCFQDHAVEYHPSSVVLFNNLDQKDPLENESSTKHEKIKSEDFELEDLQNQDTLEEIMFPSPDEDVTNKKQMTLKKMYPRKLQRLKEKILNEKINNLGRELFHLCNFCKRSFTNIADLKIHIKRHQNVLPIAMIGRVPFGFEFQSILARHIAIPFRQLTLN